MLTLGQSLWRHISAAQLALATASVYEWQPVGANQHGREDTQCPPSKSNAELAGIAGVGERTIKQARLNFQPSTYADHPRRYAAMHSCSSRSIWFACLRSALT